MSRPPRPDVFQARVRDLATNTRNVRWGLHAKDRMVERDITDRMMFDVLRTGILSGPITAGKRADEWCGKMIKTIKGRRQVGVVTVLVSDRQLFVKTVEWEDLK